MTSAPWLTLYFELAMEVVHPLTGLAYSVNLYKHDHFQ